VGLQMAAVRVLVGELAEQVNSEAACAYQGIDDH